MPPGLPKRPRVKLPTNPLEPLRGIVRGGRQQVEKAGGEVRALGNDIRGLSPTGSQMHIKAPVVEEKTSSGASDTTTLLYQLEHILAPLRQLEIHLSEGCRLLGTPCDCCAKSAYDIRNFSQETIPIAARMGRETSIFSELVTWSSKIEQVGAPDKVESGKYDNLYRQESGSASKFRKQVQSMVSELKKEDDKCPGCDEMRESISQFVEKRKRERGGGV